MSCTYIKDFQAVYSISDVRILSTDATSSEFSGYINTVPYKQ